MESCKTSTSGSSPLVAFGKARMPIGVRAFLIPHGGSASRSCATPPLFRSTVAARAFINYNDTGELVHLTGVGSQTAGGDLASLERDRQA